MDLWNRVRLPNWSLDGRGFEGQAIVSITPGLNSFNADEDSDFIAMNTIGSDEDPHAEDPHAWFSTRQTDHYVFSRTKIPALFATVVSSGHSGVGVNIYFRIREVSNYYPTITSHSDGEQVSNRVISITGSIPEEVRDEVDRVVITANGLETDTDLRSDGTFTEQVLMFLGNNVITAQGVTGNTAVTELASITLEGVEGSSFGAQPAGFHQSWVCAPVGYRPY